jgi:succinate semialdehyde reductase (NADPH)
VKAAVLNRVGEPLTIEEIPRPSPKEGEVLVRVKACGVCHTDLHVIKGEVKFPTPAVLGHEISGTVEAIGSGVEGLKAGGRVLCPFIMPCGDCFFCKRGDDDLCQKFFEFNRLQGKLYDGDTRIFRSDGDRLWMYSMAGLAEFAVVPKTAVFKLPETLPLEESCILGCAVFTAYGAIKNQSGLKEGESVAVVAVGGVGMNVVQLSRLMGAGRVIAIDVREDKLEMAMKVGATHTINSRKVEPIAEVRRITDGRGVDIAFEVLGRVETITQALDLVRDGGRVILVGIAPSGQAVPVEITRIVRREIRIIGSYGAKTRTDMPSILELASSGSLDAARIVTRRYSLDQVNEAYDALGRGEIVGRAIVVMD